MSLFPCAVCAEKDKRIADLQSIIARLEAEIRQKDIQAAGYLQSFHELSQRLMGFPDAATSIQDNLERAAAYPPEGTFAQIQKATPVNDEE